MAVDRQLLAKIAVFALLGINVGAYYYFWPKYAGRPVNQEKSSIGEPGTAQTEHPHAPVKPNEFPVGASGDAARLSVPVLPGENEKEAVDAVNRLLHHIQRESANPSPVDVVPIPVSGEKWVIQGSVPAAAAFDPKLDAVPVNPAKTFDPRVVHEPNPQPLPPLQSQPIKEGRTNRDDGDFAITSALTPKTNLRPWLLNIKKSGTQTRLTAKLRSDPARQMTVEFDILCDRVENLSDVGVQAVGSVTFVGAGFKGACQRLTVPGNAANLVIEGQVRIVPEDRGWSSSNGHLQGERIVWDLASIEGNAKATDFQPAGVLVPYVQPKAILEAPK